MGARGLYNQVEVARILAVLEAIVLPQDQNALFNYLRLPEFEIPMEEIYPLMQKAQVTNLPILSLLVGLKGGFEKAQEKLKLFTEFSRERNALETVFYVPVSYR